jgi:hypothetical protein
LLLGRQGKRILILCTGSTAALSGSTSTSGSGTISTYQWKKDDSNVSGATNATYSAALPGTYTLLITNSNSCSTVSSGHSVAEYANPTSTVTGNGYICPDGTDALSGTTSTAGSGTIAAGPDGNICATNPNPITLGAGTPISGETYAWTTVYGDPSGLSATNILDPTASPSITSCYQLTVTGPYRICTKVSTVTITVNDIQVNAIDPDICNPGLVTIVPNPVGSAGYTYLWTTTPQQTTKTITVSAPGDYTVIVTAPNGCTGTQTVHVNLKDPCVDFVYRDCDFYVNCSIFDSHSEIDRFYFEVYNAAAGTNCITSGPRIYPFNGAPFTYPKPTNCQTDFRIPFFAIRLNDYGFDFACFNGAVCNGNKISSTLQNGQNYVFRLMGRNSTTHVYSPIQSDDCIRLQVEDGCLPATRLRGPSQSADIESVITELNEYEIIPNPFNQTGVIRYKTVKENCQMIIFDIFGRRVKNISLSGAAGTMDVNLSSMGEGLYHYTVYDGRFIWSVKKLVIIR